MKIVIKRRLALVSALSSLAVGVLAFEVAPSANAFPWSPTVVVQGTVKNLMPLSPYCVTNLTFTNEKGLQAGVVLGKGCQSRSFSTVFSNVTSSGFTSNYIITLESFGPVPGALKVTRPISSLTQTLNICAKYGLIVRC
jgi:hypothetical protein